MLTLKENILIRKKIEIGKTQAANIIKKEDELMKKWQESVHLNGKRRFLKTEGLKIDQLTYEWFIKTKIFLCPDLL
jgi:hypothetical protein